MVPNWGSLPVQRPNKLKILEYLHILLEIFDCLRHRGSNELKLPKLNLTYSHVTKIKFLRVVIANYIIFNLRNGIEILFLYLGNLISA